MYCIQEEGNLVISWLSTPLSIALYTFFFTDFQHVTTKSSLIFNCLMSVTVSGPSTVLFFDTSSSQAAAVSLPADGHKSCFGFIQRLECVIFSRESS